jgi:cytidylate kinase
VNVITISRTYGSGGSEFGRSLADRLGYHYANGAFLKSIEKKPEEFSPLFSSIEDEVGPGFLARITGLMENRNFYKTALAICVYELALKSDVILVGAGGHLVLSGSPSLISLQVVRKLSSRVKLVAKERGIKVEEALKRVEAMDKAKSRFIRDYFDKELFDPLMFHLTINATFFTLDDALDLVAEYSKSYFTKIDTAGTEQFLRDRLLEKKAQMVLFHLGLSHGTAVEFEAASGQLKARGVVGGDHEKGRLVEALRKMSEVTGVTDEIKAEVLSRNIY